MRTLIWTLGFLVILAGCDESSPQYGGNGGDSGIAGLDGGDAGTARDTGPPPDSGTPPPGGWAPLAWEACDLHPNAGALSGSVDFVGLPMVLDLRVDYDGRNRDGSFVGALRGPASTPIAPLVLAARPYE